MANVDPNQTLYADAFKPMRDWWNEMTATPAWRDFQTMLDVCYPVPSEPEPKPAHTKHRPGWRPSGEYLLTRKAVRQALIEQSTPDWVKPGPTEQPPS